MTHLGLGPLDLRFKDAARALLREKRQASELVRFTAGTVSEPDPEPFYRPSVVAVDGPSPPLDFYETRGEETIHVADRWRFLLAFVWLLCVGCDSRGSRATPSATSSSSAVGDPSPSPSTDQVPPPALAPSAAVWHPAQPRLAVAAGHRLVVVDMANRPHVRQIGTATARIEAIDWAADAPLIATMSRTLQIWNLRDGKAVSMAVNARHMRLSPDGRDVVVWGRSVSLWPAGAQQATWTSRVVEAWDVAFIPQSQQLAGIHAGGVVTWQQRDGRVVENAVFPTHGTSGLALSPHGRWAAISLDQHRLVLHPVRGGTPIQLFETADPDDDLRDLRFALDGRTLQIRSDAGWRLWRLPSLTAGAVVRPAPTDEVTWMSNRGGARLVQRSDGALALVAGDQRTDLGRPRGRSNPAFSHDDRYLALTGQHLSIWEVGPPSRKILTWPP